MENQVLKFETEKRKLPPPILCVLFTVLERASEELEPGLVLQH